MKLLKLKVYLSCFLLALAGSFFMTSCSSEADIDALPQEELLIEKAMLLPVSISQQGETLVEAHLSNISEDLEITYLNNFKVGQYLVSIGKAQSILEDLPNSANLSKIDLTSHLSSDQLQTLESELINSLPEIQVRGCTPIYQWDNCCFRNQWNQCVGCWKNVGFYCN